MTREDIIRMAQDVYGECDWHESALIHLERFAALVAAAERERLAQSIEQMPFGDTAQSFATYVREFK